MSGRHDDPLEKFVMRYAPGRVFTRRVIGRKSEYSHNPNIMRGALKIVISADKRIPINGALIRAHKPVIGWPFHCNVEAPPVAKSPMRTVKGIIEAVIPMQANFKIVPADTRSTTIFSYIESSTANCLGITLLPGGRDAPASETPLSVFVSPYYRLLSLSL